MKNRNPLFCILTLGFLVSFGSNANAQSVQNMNGRVLRQTNYSDVSGSPYLFQDWSKGTVTFKDGKASDKVELKYDQMSDILLFKNSTGAEMEVADPIKEFVISDPKLGTSRIFRHDFKPVDDYNEQSFYEVLYDGSVKFTKKVKKSIMTEREYNASTDTKKIIEKPVFFIVKDNQPILVNKNEKAILAAIGDKTPELTKYVKENKLNLKNDADILKVLEYYATISKGS